MQVTKITAPAEKVVAVAHKISKEQMHNEINYYRAEKLTRKMLEEGLITIDESDRILAEARKIFVPIMAELI